MNINDDDSAVLVASLPTSPQQPAQIDQKLETTPEVATNNHLLSTPIDEGGARAAKESASACEQESYEYTDTTPQIDSTCASQALPSSVDLAYFCSPEPNTFQAKAVDRSPPSPL